ncbi:MAG: hypothetical protein KAJ51_05525, partial [Thermoplasmata archaeon]|nr:hypothetical protein [Thermoplasmata archaeon]
TLGTLGLPVISYNVPEFWERIRGGEESTLVSGLCPLSTIVDELGFVLPDERIVRPEMCFETLAVEYEDIKEIAWPKRPIISDYITLRNIFELYSEYRLNSKVSVIIWYPNYEYYLDLSENILKNYLDSGIIQNQQIIHGLNEIKKRYFKLIEFVKSELGIGGNQNQDIKIIEVDENKFNELERYRQNMEFTFFKNIYGSWHGNEPRRKLYEQLIIKHIKPVFDGLNTLHLDNSYELWVDLLGSIIIEQNRSELSGNFGWINYPSLPSLSLSRMREFNAPNNDKLYFSEDPIQFQMQLEKLPNKYIFHLAPLLLGKNEVLTKNHDEIIDEFKIKLNLLNGIYQS